MDERSPARNHKHSIEFNDFNNIANMPDCLSGHDGVKCYYSVEIVESEIPNAGRGLFATWEIKPGREIFSLHPKVATIAPELKEHACDNCFAVTIPLFQTGPHSGTLERCAGCKLVYYCDKKCQREAWYHHHRWECKVFVELKDYTINDTKFLDMIGIRSLARLMILLGAKSIEGEDREEYEKLKNNREMWESRGSFAEVMKVATELLIKHTDFADGEEAAKEFSCTMASNQLTILHPVLQGSRSITADSPERSTWVAAGYCLAPFVSLMNHSCLPNCLWTFNGNELRVRSIKNIARGEELTIAYTNTSRDYHQRNDELLKNYNFVCTCALCKYQFKKADSITPAGELRVHLLNLINIGKPTTGEEVAAIQAGIKMMNDAGYGYKSYPMRPLHMMLLSGFIRARYYQLALKAALVLFYFIEPVQVPPTPRDDRLETLQYLILLMDHQESQTTQEIRKYLYYHLREDFVHETTFCYGRNSIASGFEKREFERVVAVELGGKFESILVNKEADKFFQNMNKLLQTMGLPEIKKKQMFWIHRE